MIKLRYLGEDLRVQIFTLSVFFVTAYWVPLKVMVNTWRNNEDYSYGFLIPLISAYLFWEKRKVLREISLQGFWGILPILVFFVLFSLYGILGSSGNISMPSIPILIILFTGFCFGIESVRKLILPLGFLFFMIPLPPIIDRYIGLYLKTISSKLGGALIGLFDIPVHVSGNVIDLGVIQLQVVDACNGLRYIFPLLALGILYAYFFERVAWKRIFCVLITVPLGVLINALRIGVTGILANSFGRQFSEGFFHAFSGWILFVTAFIILFLIGRLLAFFPQNVKVNKESFASMPVSDVTLYTDGKKTKKAFLLSIVILSCVAVLSLSTGTLPAIKIKGGMQNFPLQFGNWQGKYELVDPVIIKESGAEDAFSGYYSNLSGDAVSLYLGYRSSAFLSNENFFHSPTVCIPSTGWVEQEVKRKTIANVPYFDNLDVTMMVIEKGGVRQLLYFWFQTKDEATYDKNINRFDLSIHALRRNNTHDLFIRPVTTLSETESIENAQKRLDGFTREMMTALLQYLKERQFEE